MCKYFSIKCLQNIKIVDLFIYLFVCLFAFIYFFHSFIYLYLLFLFFILFIYLLEEDILLASIVYLPKLYGYQELHCLPHIHHCITSQQS